MKIGICTPVGRLDKFGYQYNSSTILKNLQNFADEVLVVSTSDFNKHEDFNGFEKVSCISNPDTWFDVKDGEDIFSFNKLIENHVLAMDYFKKQNFDIFLSVHINQYIPQSSYKGLYKVFEKMLQNKKPFEWLYKKYQVKDLLFDADVCLPWILNLNIDNPYRMYSDSIKHINTNEQVSIRHGHFKSYNDIAIIDILGEETVNDVMEKHNFTIKELRILTNEYNPSNASNLSFDEKKYLHYYLSKTNQKKLSNDALDTTGQNILNNSQDDFVSKYLKENYKYLHKNYLLKFLSFFRKFF